MPNVWPQLVLPTIEPYVQPQPFLPSIAPYGSLHLTLPLDGASIWTFEQFLQVLFHVVPFQAQLHAFVLQAASRMQASLPAIGPVFGLGFEQPQRLASKTLLSLPRATQTCDEVPPEARPLLLIFFLLLLELRLALPAIVLLKPMPIA